MEYQLIENKIDISEEESNASDDNRNKTESAVIDIPDNEIQSDTSSNDIDNSEKVETHVGFFKQFLLKRVYVTGLVSFISLFILNIIYSAIFGSYLEEAQNSNEESISELTKLHPVLMITYACIMGPMLEEFVFRRLMFGILKKYSKILAYLVSCFFFAFGHFGFSFSTLVNEFLFFPDYFLAAAILAYTYDYDGYILSSMVAHMLYNSSMVILSFFVDGGL